MSQPLISELGNQELARVSNAGAYSVGAYSVGAYTELATDFGAGKSDTSKCSQRGSLQRGGL